jgi:hypothetical protein
LRLNPYGQKPFAAAAIIASALTLYPHAVALAQQTAPTQPDIYANFVGVWIGIDHYLKDGKETTEPLRLTIQETKKKDAMKWEYVYGTGDQKDDRPTRHVTFHPAKAEIILQWGRDEADHYKAVDLESLAKNGYGAFYAISTNQEDGKKVTHLAKFDLEANTFRYAWFHSEDGKNFSKDSSFLLRREVGASIPR